MADATAFAEVFQAEMDACAHDALVGMYEWANRQTYGDPSDDMRARAEAWAKQVEDAGLTIPVLGCLPSYEGS
jgi:hypothetical protein